MEISLEITINQPVSKVFDFFLDPKNLKSWVFDFTRYVQTRGRGRKKGNKSKHIFGKGKTQLEVFEEVTECKRPETFEVFMTVKHMQSLNSYEFEDAGDNKTRIKLHLDITMKPAVLNLVSPFMKNSFKKQQLKDLRKLKEVLENAN